MKEFSDPLFGTSRPEMFCKKDSLKNFAKLTGKNFVVRMRPGTWNFIKKETLAQVFALNFAKFLRTPCLNVFKS